MIVFAELVYPLKNFAYKITRWIPTSLDFDSRLFWSVGFSYACSRARV